MPSVKIKTNVYPVFLAIICKMINVLHALKFQDVLFVRAKAYVYPAIKAFTFKAISAITVVKLSVDVYHVFQKANA